MMDRWLRPVAGHLIRPVRAAALRWDAVGVRREAVRVLRDEGAWEIGPIHRARSGIRIAPIRSISDGRQAILKITDDPEGVNGLERERLALASLSAEDRLRPLRPLLAEILGAGSDGRWSYLVQRALPGEPATARLASHRNRFLPDASAVAARLHGATATPRVVAGAEITEWVQHPLAVLRGLVGQRHGSHVARVLEDLARELADTISGATVPLGWVHGDLWSDNILIDARNGEITGIVDWDSTSPAGLAAHDQLHLVLYSRKLLARSEIGTEICRALGLDPQWDASELPAVLAATDNLPGRDERSRHRLGVVLYWLRLVTVNLARQPKMTRSQRWLDKNVRAVLACL